MGKVPDKVVREFQERLDASSDEALESALSAAARPPHEAEFERKIRLNGAARSSSPVCQHRQYGTDVPRRIPPHEMCDSCRRLSLSPRTSDFWICCQCRGHVCYDREARRAALRYVWNHKRSEDGLF